MDNFDLVAVERRVILRSCPRFLLNPCVCIWILDCAFEERGNREVTKTCPAVSADMSENKDWMNLECVSELAVTVEILSLFGAL